MDIKVTKIGGSTFKKENILELAEYITKNYEPYRTVIVVSALSRSPYPYSTDELLKIFEEINLIKEIPNNSSNGNHQSNKSEKYSSGEKYFLDLSKSFTVSCGENIATGLLSFAINKIAPNFRAIPLNAFQTGIITTDKPIDSDILDINPQNLLNLLENKYTPVICGFQGISKSGYLTTLKRGGTDITAAYIAKILNSKDLYIIKDVDGLKSTSPKIVENSITIEKCHIDELAEASYNGNPIVHPEAINIAQQNNINIIIKSIYSPKFTIASSNILPQQIISNISNKDNLIKFIIKLPSYTKLKTDSLHKALELIFYENISIDFINLDILNNSVSFTIETQNQEKIENILNKINLTYKTIKNLSKISIIGYNMRGKPGIMYRINKALINQHLTILQAQDSHISISLLVKQKYTKEAIKALHKEFFENNNQIGTLTN